MIFCWRAGQIQMMLRWSAMERYRKAKLKASSRADSLLAQATACRWSASAI